MCSIVILRRSGTAWPLVLAANRDEMRARTWDPPGRHWFDRPEILAGRDHLSNGSWLGINDHGVVAAVLNRAGSLGPEPGKRSRGELVLEALDHSDAIVAVEQLSHIDPKAYRSFNLVVADNRDGYWLRSLGPSTAKVDVTSLPLGYSMLTESDLNDRSSPRINRWLPEFEASLSPDPDLDDWEAWQELLRKPAADNPMDGMVVTTDAGFETVSSSILAVPASDHVIAGEKAAPIWLFAPGRPDQWDYQPVIF